MKSTLIEEAALEKAEGTANTWQKRVKSVAKTRVKSDTEVMGKTRVNCHRNKEQRRNRVKSKRKIK